MIAYREGVAVRRRTNVGNGSGSVTSPSATASSSSTNEIDGTQTTDRPASTRSKNSFAFRPNRRRWSVIHQMSACVSETAISGVRTTRQPVPPSRKRSARFLFADSF